MEEIFITGLLIDKVRHLEDIYIEFSMNERKHLILTGKNGSGKTSLLEAIREFFKGMEHFKTLPSDRCNRLSVNALKLWLFGCIDDIDIDLSSYHNLSERYNSGELVLAYFPAQRQIKMEMPKGPQKLELPTKLPADSHINQMFLQYIVNLYTEKAYAFMKNNQEEVQKIDQWFLNFEKSLKEIFEDDNLKFEFDEKNFNFNIITEGREPFDLNQLSHGYSAIINIITDLILRMENKKTKGYDVQGIVLIDEIETHLHIDLQKKILPFLTRFFPKIQFIVTTHSPFVLNSIDNAVIYDLEKRIKVENLSAYSYEGIVESYFNIDQYSEVIKNKINRYEELLDKQNTTEEEADELFDLRHELKEDIESQPAQYMIGLKAKFFDLELKRKSKQKMRGGGND